MVAAASLSALSSSRQTAAGYSINGVLRSPRVRAALLSGGKREMMTGRALAGSTRSTRATPSSLLTVTVVGRKMAGGYIVRRCSTDEV